MTACDEQRAVVSQLVRTRVTDRVQECPRYALLCDAVGEGICDMASLHSVSSAGSSHGSRQPSAVPLVILRAVVASHLLQLLLLIKHQAGRCWKVGVNRG